MTVTAQLMPSHETALLLIMGGGGGAAAMISTGCSEEAAGGGAGGGEEIRADTVKSIHDSFSCRSSKLPSLPRCLSPFFSPGPPFLFFHCFSFVFTHFHPHLFPLPFYEVLSPFSLDPSFLFTLSPLIPPINLSSSLCFFSSRLPFSSFSHLLLLLSFQSSLFY